MKRPTVVTCETSDTLLELAAMNDIDGFTNLLNRDSVSVDQVVLWYVCQKGSKQVVRDKRTPLMVASMYGSLDVMRKILCLSRRDVNRSTGDDQTTTLHCAASCGSLNAVEAVKLLLAKGADPNLMDANCLRPADMIVDSPEYPDLKHTLHEILGLKDGVLENSTYSDEFMMYSFKVIPCAQVHFHIWKECPFVHPGETARRRDPRKYPYSWVPCPKFRKGICRSGDLCEYAHGIFEWWMHPAKYRTRLCDYGTGCNRNVCFFAHNQGELRLLDVKSPSPSGNEMLNWQVVPRSNFRSSLFSDRLMISSRNNLSEFNQFQSMSPQGIEAISPMRARALNLAADYQHGQPHVRSLDMQEIGSTSVDPWLRWSSSSGEPDLVFNKKEPDLSWIQSARNLNLMRSREYVTNPWPSPFMGSLVGPWSQCGSSSGKANMAVKTEELDLSWLHSLPDEARHERTVRLDFEQEMDEPEYLGSK